MSTLNKTLLLVAIAIAIFAFFYFDGRSYISLDNIQNNRESLLKSVQQNFTLSVLLFSVSYTISVALSLPIATLLTLLAGFLFGLYAGIVIVVFSATLGATLIFMLARSSLGSFLRQKAGRYYARVDTNFKNNDVQYLLFLRLVPLFPFAIVNILPALFDMPLKRFIFATAIGIIPGSAVYVYAGQSLADINSLSDIISREILLAFILLGLLALSPSLIKKFKYRKPTRDHS